MLNILRGFDSFFIIVYFFFFIFLLLFCLFFGVGGVFIVCFHYLFIYFLIVPTTLLGRDLEDNKSCLGAMAFRLTPSPSPLLPTSFVLSFLTIAFCLSFFFFLLTFFHLFFSLGLS